METFKSIVVLIFTLLLIMLIGYGVFSLIFRKSISTAPVIHFLTENGEYRAEEIQKTGDCYKIINQRATFGGTGSYLYCKPLVVL